MYIFYIDLHSTVVLQEWTTERLKRFLDLFLHNFRVKAIIVQTNVSNSDSWKHRRPFPASLSASSGRLEYNVKK